MAGTRIGQWVPPAAMFAVCVPLLHFPPAMLPVSWECGPGYHKPLFGRCVPDPGVPLLRYNRYAVSHSARQRRGHLPTPLRSMAPWGPTVHG